jgi:hypothetical protein
VQLTGRELANVLQRHGVKEVRPHGEKFDHNLHQAMFEVEDASQPHGTVNQVLQVGYTIGDRLLRPGSRPYALAYLPSSRDQKPFSGFDGTQISPPSALTSKKPTPCFSASRRTCRYASSAWDQAKPM